MESTLRITVVVSLEYASSFKAGQQDCSVRRTPKIRKLQRSRVWWNAAARIGAGTAAYLVLAAAQQAASADLTPSVPVEQRTVGKWVPLSGRKANEVLMFFDQRPDTKPRPVRRNKDGSVAFNDGKSYDPRDRSITFTQGRSEYKVTPGRRVYSRLLRPQAEGNAPSGKVGEALSASGTGFFITEDGFLLTNFHVVKGRSRIMVRAGEDLLPAHLLCGNPRTDVAVLKVDGRFTPLPLGGDGDVSLGSSVFTIGFPNIEIQGMSPKFTRGEISALAGPGDDKSQFQISVPIQPGNSGGPLVDVRGNVVGITASQLDASRMMQTGRAIPQNVNYAIKVSQARDMLEKLPLYAEGANIPPPDLKLPEANTSIQTPEAAAAAVSSSTALVLVWKRSE